MSDTETFDDLFDENGEPKQDAAPKALRDHAKAQQNRAKELEQELAGLRKEQRETKVQNFLKEKGLDEAALDFIDEKTDLEQFYEKHGTRFAKSGEGEAGGGDTGDQSQGPSGQPALSNDQVAQMQQTQNVQPGSYEPGSMDEVGQKVDSILASDIPQAEKDAQLRELGALA